MFVYKVSEEHNKILNEWDKLYNYFQENAKEIIRNYIKGNYVEIDGVKLINFCESFCFTILNKEDKSVLMEGFRYSKKYGGYIPNKNSKRGKEISENWKKFNFRDLDSVHLGTKLFKDKVFSVSYNFKKEGNQHYLWEFKGFKPEDYGYIKEEITLNKE